MFTLKEKNKNGENLQQITIREVVPAIEAEEQISAAAEIGRATNEEDSIEHGHEEELENLFRKRRSLSSVLKEVEEQARHGTPTAKRRKTTKVSI